MRMLSLRFSSVDVNGRLTAGSVASADAQEKKTAQKFPETVPSRPMPKGLGRRLCSAFLDKLDPKRTLDPYEERLLELLEDLSKAYEQGTFKFDDATATSNKTNQTRKNLATMVDDENRTYRFESVFSVEYALFNKELLTKSISGIYGQSWESKLTFDPLRKQVIYSHVDLGIDRTFTHPLLVKKAECLFDKLDQGFSALYQKRQRSEKLRSQMATAQQVALEDKKLPEFDL